MQLDRENFRTFYISHIYVGIYFDYLMEARSSTGRLQPDGRATMAHRDSEKYGYFRGTAENKAGLCLQADLPVKTHDICLMVSYSVENNFG